MFQKQFEDIIQLIKQSRSNALKTVNTELINLYWNIGEYISRQLAIAGWGEKTVDELADYIQINHPELKGFNRRGLYRMKQFYGTYASMAFVSTLRTQKQTPEYQENIIVSPLVTQLESNDIRQTILAKLTWTNHLIILARTNTNEEKEFYIHLCIKENYSKRELERQINSGLFERVMIGNTKLTASLREIHPGINNSFKDSYIFEYLNLSESYSERDLQKGLINQMKNVILELGKDFLFIDEEYRMNYLKTIMK